MPYRRLSRDEMQGLRAAGKETRIAEGKRRAAILLPVPPGGPVTLLGYWRQRCRVLRGVMGCFDGAPADEAVIRQRAFNEVASEWRRDGGKFLRTAFEINRTLIP